METLSNRLTALREAKGWSKTYVAQKLSIKTVSTYANWEYGIRQPDQEMLIKIADLYEVSVDYLLGRENSSNVSKQDKEFQAFINNPNLQRMFKEMKDSPEEDLEELQQIWNIIKNRKK